MEMEDADQTCHLTQALKPPEYKLRSSEPGIAQDLKKKKKRKFLGGSGGNFESQN